MFVGTPGAEFGGPTEDVSSEANPASQKPERCDPTRAYNLSKSRKGMMLSHRAIRKDLDQLNKAINTLNIEDDTQVHNLSSWLVSFTSLVLRHSESEERYYIPWIKQRIDIPPNVDISHDAMDNLVRAVNSQAKALQHMAKGEERNKLVSQLKTSICDMEHQLCRHLEQIDNTLPQLVLKHFTFGEYQVMLRKCIKQDGYKVGREILPWLTQTMTPEEERTFVKGQLPLPMRLLYWATWKPHFRHSTEPKLQSIIDAAALPHN